MLCRCMGGFLSQHCTAIRYVWFVLRFSVLPWSPPVGLERVRNRTHDAGYDQQCSCL